MSKFWVGELTDGRLVLFDETIPQNDEDFVILFEYSSSSLQRFPRILTRNNIKKIIDTKVIDRVVTRYLTDKEIFSTIDEKPENINYRQRIFDPNDDPHIIDSINSNNIKLVGSEDSLIESSKFDDLHEEMLEDMGRIGYYRPNLKTPNYEYSDDDLDALEGDYFLGNY